MFVFKIRERICHPLIHHHCPYKLNFWTTPISGAAKILSEHGSGMFWIKTDFHPHALFIPSNGLIVGIKNHCFRMLSDWSADSHDILLLVLLWFGSLPEKCWAFGEGRKLDRKLSSNHDPVSNWIKLDRFSESVSPRLFEVHDHDLRSRDPGICDGPLMGQSESLNLSEIIQSEELCHDSWLQWSSFFGCWTRQNMQNH